MSPAEPLSVRRVHGLPHQLEFWLDQTSQYLAIVGGYGTGKTRALFGKARFLAEANRGCDGLLVVPTFRLARRVHVREWPAIASEEPGLRLKWRASDQALDWYWYGEFLSRLWLGTAEDPDSLVAQNAGYMLGDEPGLWSEEVFERATARVRDPRAPVPQIALAGTPEGLNWFASKFSNPDRAQRYRTIHAQCWHPSLRDSGYVQRLIHQYAYDSSLLASYVNGMFVPLRVGRCFIPFSRVKHAAQAVTYDPQLPLVLSCDFNVDRMRWLTYQVSPREIRALHEITLGTNSRTEHAAKAFCERWARRHKGHVVVTGDATGNSRSTQASRTDYQIIREVLRANGFESIGQRVPDANPGHKESVDAANYHLSGRGRKVLIDPSCMELVLDLEQCHWKKGAPQIADDDVERKHASDTFRYLVWQFARPEAMTASVRTGRVSTTGNPAYARA